MKTTMAMSRSEVVETSDMTLAAYLSLHGFDYDLVPNPDGTDPKRAVLWSFRDRDGEVADCASIFQRGEARVEPERFQRELTATRRRLFDHLNNR